MNHSWYNIIYNVRKSKRLKGNHLGIYIVSLSSSDNECDKNVPIYYYILLC